MQINTTIIKFPEIKLDTQYGHKLSEYFGNLFKEHSDLLHKHYASGQSKYRYPKVQYKLIDNVPHLVGVEEGGKLLIELFLTIKQIKIEDEAFLVNSKNITSTVTELDDFSELNEYKFVTLWVALNQKNHQKYLQFNSQEEKNVFLNKQIQNNILSFYKSNNFFIKERIMVTSKLQEKSTKFKDKTMLAFSGSFVTNAILPEYIGIGKSVSKGFGTIVNG